MVRRSAATTIAEVARHAGVSPATVSRVMNGRFLGEPAIADRVRASAAELSYSPNHLARSFALGQTNAIAFLVPDLANPSFQGVLTGLSKAAAADGYRVLVADSAESAEDEPLLAAEVRRRCDAIVLCAPRMSEDDLVRATETLGPVVLMNRSSPRVTAPTLSVDSRAASRVSRSTCTRSVTAALCTWRDRTAWPTRTGCADSRTSRSLRPTRRSSASRAVQAVKTGSPP